MSDAVSDLARPIETSMRILEAMVGLDRHSGPARARLVAEQTPIWALSPRYVTNSVCPLVQDANDLDAVAIGLDAVTDVVLLLEETLATGAQVVSSLADFGKVARSVECVVEGSLVPPRSVLASSLQSIEQDVVVIGLCFGRDNRRAQGQTSGFGTSSDRARPMATCIRSARHSRVNGTPSPRSSWAIPI